MEDFLYVWIEKKCYKIYTHNDTTWRLFYFIDRQKLNIKDAHSLDYWRKKGVIEGEEEKEG
jgi:hypothetical protein